jgi:hypothetical protein
MLHGALWHAPSSAACVDMCRIIAILENALAKLSVLEKITPDEPEEGQQVCACVLVGVRSGAPRQSSCGGACACSCSIAYGSAR